MALSATSAQLKRPSQRRPATVVYLAALSLSLGLTTGGGRQLLRLVLPTQVQRAEAKLLAPSCMTVIM